MADACSVESFPFVFYDEKGFNVSGVLNDDGICVFPDASCGVDSASSKCCSPKNEYTITGSNYMFIAFIFIYITQYANRYLFGKLWEEDEAARSAMKRFDDKLPWWATKLPRFLKEIFEYGIWISVTVAVIIPIFMKESIQENLTVTSRNILMSAEAFLVPYKEIFQFIEDIVSVRVNYALSQGNKALADQLVHAGIAGCFFTGLLAAGLATILGVIPQILQALTNPGLANDVSLYPGCDIIEAAEGSEHNYSVLLYWLVEVWSFPGVQLGMVLNGFMMGALEISTTGWIMAISLSMIPIIWFAGVDSTNDPLLLLSWAEFAGAWVFPVLSILYLISPLGSTLRENTGVTLSISKLHRSIFLSFSSAEDKPSDTPSSVIPATKVIDDSSNEVKSNTTSAPEAAYGAADLTEDKSSNTPTPAPATNVLDDSSNEENPSTTSPPEAAYGAADAISQNAEEDGPEDFSMKDLLNDGLKVMFVDVTVQVCVSLTVYLALSSNAATGYQLTALQSQLPTYGMAYAFGMAITFKIVGPMFMSMNAYKQFAMLSRVFVLCSALLVPLIVGASVPFSNGLAYSAGGNACEYAGSNECVPFFTNVFGENSTGGTYTLPFTFNAFAFGSSIESVYIVIRAILLTLMDLDYMVKCTIVSMILYIAAIIVATQVDSFGEEAVAYFIAMYIPQLTLIILFLVRLEILIRRMTSGQKEAWSKKSSRSLRMQ